MITIIMTEEDRPVSPFCELYKRWPEEKIFEHFMLQYDLSRCAPEESYVEINFRIIEWRELEYVPEKWKENHDIIELVMEGCIGNVGIGYANFFPKNDGHTSYFHLPAMGRVFAELHKLCVEFCTDYHDVYYE